MTSWGPTFTHRQRVLLMLTSFSVAPSPSTNVLTDILSLIFFSHGQVEPTARWYHFP